MSEYCGDCGCRKVNGYCTNCQEEAYIAFEQAPEMEFSPEFMKKAWGQVSGASAVATNLTTPTVTAMGDIRRQHAEWSDETFGSVGPVGPLKHLSKEAMEAAENPADLLEWADMYFLIWDAQRRAGITDDQIVQACTEKLEINKSRKWPEPKDGEPRLHIKEDKEPSPQPLVRQCPRCGSTLITTERRPNGNSTCVQGHVFPTASAEGIDRAKD